MSNSSSAYNSGPQWEYTTVNVGPGESWYDQLRAWGENGWEAWYIEKTAEGWREIYFKRQRLGSKDART